MADIDLRTVDCHIQAEPLAKDGLRKRRNELEKIVAPHVTTRRTSTIIRLKGKRRYLKTPFPHQAVFALQFIYNLDEAWKAGDIDRAVRMAVGFARSDNEVQNLELFGSDSIQALVHRARTQREYVERGKKTKKLTSDDDILLLRIAYANNRGHKKWLQRTTDELKRHGIRPLSTRTVSRRLHQLKIVDNVGGVRGQR